MEKKKQNVLLIIMGLLILASIAITFAIGDNSFGEILVYITLISVALYGFYFYKKPHGNMLKYALLIYAISSILSDATWMPILSEIGGANSLMIRMVCFAIMCYCTGRLDRIEQNKKIFTIIEVCLIAISIYWCIALTDGLVLMIGYFRSPIEFLTLMIAYFVRYKEHKAAGISDK